MKSGNDDLARPRDFGAGYGEGVHVGLSLGGGGLFFVAWQVAYLHELAERGLDVAGAQRVVGTSAGSVVASVLEAGHLRRLHREVSIAAKLPRLLGALAPSSGVKPSQRRALDSFVEAEDAEPDTIRAIGHAALAADATSAGRMARSVGVILLSRQWPSAALQITCVDAFTGERCVVTRTAEVPVARAVAASSAVPGLFSPQPILGRRCMDGGVSGTGTHLDLLGGARRALVLCLTDGGGAETGAMTVGPTSLADEVAALEGTGTRVFHRIPETMDLLTLMDPAAVPDALVMGRRQAAADTDELRTFLR